MNPVVMTATGETMSRALILQELIALKNCRMN